jgi:hypothetical protein
MSRGCCHAHPSPGDALVPEARGRDRPQGDGRWRISQTFRPRSALPRFRGGGPPHLQGFRSCPSQPWRCARPRARSLERATGSGAHPRPPAPDRRCRAFAVEAHRISRGCCHAHPSPGDALVPERGAWRATGSGAYPKAPPDRRCRAFAVEDHRISRGCCHAHPSLGDVFVPERGARNGRREVAPTPDLPPQIGAAAPSRWRPTASPGVPVMPIPALEMRSFPSAEPGTGDVNQRTLQTFPRSALSRLRGGGPPHLQGVLPCPSQPWRCARPRARSPERATGSGAYPKAPPDRRCRAFAVEDHRISRGSCHAHPSPGDALVPERGARRATGGAAHPRPPAQIGAAAPSRWSPPHLQGFRSCLSQPWRCARSRGARSRPTAGRYLGRAWRISALPDMAFQSRSCSSQS